MVSYVHGIIGFIACDTALSLNSRQRCSIDNFVHTSLNTFAGKNLPAQRCLMDEAFRKLAKINDICDSL